MNSYRSKKYGEFEEGLKQERLSIKQKIVLLKKLENEISEKCTHLDIKEEHVHYDAEGYDSAWGADYQYCNICGIQLTYKAGFVPDIKYHKDWKYYDKEKKETLNKEEEKIII